MLAWMWHARLIDRKEALKATYFPSRSSIAGGLFDVDIAVADRRSQPTFFSGASSLLSLGLFARFFPRKLYTLLLQSYISINIKPLSLSKKEHRQIQSSWLHQKQKMEEQKVEEPKPEEKKEENAEEKPPAEEKKEEEPKPPAPFVLFIDLHCVGCAKKIEKSLLRIPG
ncbi:unnamed protein product [Lactuca saligna]|uniref:HMA domain-containing protein n=1 Tax=Lactuca saligna TaxID=75948 RepID=A0AA35YI23_LACSI|nr:unnamed protein product [Lactuca saligna]